VLSAAEAGRWVGAPGPGYREPSCSHEADRWAGERAGAELRTSSSTETCKGVTELASGLLVGRGGGGGVGHFCRQTR